jgi:hypothetical protein
MNPPGRDFKNDYGAWVKVDGENYSADGLETPKAVPSWDRRGGCASRKCCEATFESADGVVILD